MKFTLIAEREQIQDRKAGLKEKGKRKKVKGERFLSTPSATLVPLSQGDKER